jgi:Secreted protein containing C-terminal beta-propeller domain distantly related to WD-40 repeats
MRQRSTIIWLAVVVAASAALILLLNIAPEAPKGVAQPPAVRISEVPTINAIPIVKLSEVDYLLQTAPGYAPAAALYSASERPAAAGAFPAQSTTQAAAANLQVAGVDEEDYVKFDGENLYVAVDGRVYVVGPDLAVKASAPCPAHSCAVFVWGDRLLTYGMRDFGLITAYLYRLPALAKVAEFNFSGVLPVAARMAEGFVYIVTTAPPSDVVINGVKVAEAPLLSLDVPPVAMVIAAVDMNNDRFNASVFVSGFATRVYMKDGRLYVAAPLGTPQLLYKAVAKAWDALPPDVKARLNASDPLALYKSLTSLLGERDGAGKLLKALNGTNVTTATSIYVFDLNGLDRGAESRGGGPGESPQPVRYRGAGRTPRGRHNGQRRQVPRPRLPRGEVAAALPHGGRHSDLGGRQARGHHTASAASGPAPGGLHTHGGRAAQLGLPPRPRRADRQRLGGPSPRREDLRGAAGGENPLPSHL